MRYWRWKVLVKSQVAWLLVHSRSVWGIWSWPSIFFFYILIFISKKAIIFGDKIIPPFFLYKLSNNYPRILNWEPYKNDFIPKIYLINLIFSSLVSQHMEKKINTLSKKRENIINVVIKIYIYIYIYKRERESAFFFFFLR